ncbi:MAG: DNA internalization-related competence protein ComEC/Rec2 [Tissierellia bacterium]|nr:DNA internalization-related competence protein ComEC/Rec2 [Tissierellia bacterium]
MVYLLFTIIGVLVGYETSIFVGYGLFIVGSLFLLGSQHSQYHKYSRLVWVLALACLSIQLQHHDIPKDIVDCQGKIIREKNNYFVLKTDQVNGQKFPSYFIYYDERPLPLGSQVFIEGPVRSPLPQMNEGNISEKNRLYSRGIYGIGTVKSYQILKEPARGYRWQRYWKKRGEAMLDQKIQSPANQILKGMILSDTSYMEGKYYDQFRHLGMAHLLAVSGLHITIIAYSFRKLLIHWTGRRKVSDIVCLSFLLLYLWMIGFPIGGIRGTALFILSLTQFYGNNLWTLEEKIALVATGILLVSPHRLFSPSFLLSFGGVWSILWIYPKISHIIPGEGSISSMISLTFSIQLGIAPITLYFFHEVYPVTFLTNLLIVPFYTILLHGGLLVFFGIFPQIIGTTINFFMNHLLKVQSLLQMMIPLKIYGRSFTLWTVVAYYTLLILFLYGDRWSSWIYPIRRWIYGYSLYLFLFMGILTYRQYHSFQYTQLYIGQGDCGLISYRGQYYMVDTGGSAFTNNNLAKNYLLPYLHHRGIRRLDGLFVSHFDMDHIGNIRELYQEIDIPIVYISYIPEDQKLLAEMIEHSKVFQVKQHDHWKLGEKTGIRVLLDVDDYEEDNDKSMILEIYHGEKNILCTGDATTKIEEKITGHYDVLKVAHHGSKTSTEEAFLVKIHPEVALISAGVNNQYGHPHQEVLDHLAHQKIPTFITSRDGQIQLTIDKNQLKINTIKGKRKTKILFFLWEGGMICLCLLYIRKHYELSGDL